MPPTSAAFRMADRLAKGHLAERLSELRTEGLRWHQVSQRLYADYGIEVHPETLRGWWHEIQPPTKPESTTAVGE